MTLPAGAMSALGQKLTRAVQLGMSAMGQKLTSHLSFDHFVNRNQQIMWDSKSERLGCF